MKRPNPKARRPKSDNSRTRKPAPRWKDGKRVKEPASVAPKADAASFPMRINRFIARSGVCSRREADEMIKSGLVELDGAVVSDYSTQVLATSEVKVNGKVITAVGGVYILLNKPSGAITTKSDEKGRQTVLDLIDVPDEIKSALFPVGRLDRDTTGALLLSSDGDLAHRLMHPSFEVEKLYRVRAGRAVTEEEIARLLNGIELEDGLAKADQAGYLAPGDLTEVGVAMHSGRNRIVRRMFEALGHEVKQLERVRYAGITTSGVRRGKWRKLTDKEVSRLYRAVKMKR